MISKHFSSFPKIFPSERYIVFLFEFYFCTNIPRYPAYNRTGPPPTTGSKKCHKKLQIWGSENVDFWDPQTVHFWDPENVHFWDPKTVHFWDPKTVHFWDPENISFWDPEIVHSQSFL